MVNDTPTHRSTALPLALAWAALIAYASLYPFSEWRWPPGASLGSLLALAWPRYHDRFDIVANLLGYVPLGLLAFVALLRGRRPVWVAVLGAFALAAALSYAMEFVQQMRPRRVPSLLDWVLNAAGGGLGALLGLGLQASGVMDRLHRLVDGWLQHRGFGVLLLLLWPVGLLLPAPVPLGLGQVGPWLAEVLTAVVEDTQFAGALAPWLAPLQPPLQALSPPAEWLTVLLGLLGPTLLLYTLARPGWRRLVLAGLAAAVGVAVTTLSTALTFGPDHAWAWATGLSVPALVAALVLAVPLARSNRRLCAALALASITAAVVMVSHAPADPYYAQSLQGWEQGRFIRFHGAAQWVAWLWPYAALAWLLNRLGRGG